MFQLTYSDYVHSILKQVEYYALTHRIEYDPSYIQELNHICPACQKNIPLSPENEPQHGFVRSFVIEDHVAIPYALCESCSLAYTNPEDMDASPLHSFGGAFSLDYYILFCLGYDTDIIED